MFFSLSSVTCASSLSAETMTNLLVGHSWYAILFINIFKNLSSPSANNPTSTTKRKAGAANTSGYK